MDTLEGISHAWEYHYVVYNSAQGVLSSVFWVFNRFVGLYELISNSVVAKYCFI